MKLFLIIALCAFALTCTFAMPVADSVNQDPLPVVPIDKSSNQHVLRRETSSSDNKSEEKIIVQEESKPTARLDDKLPEDEKKIEEPKKDDEKLIEEPKKEEKIMEKSQSDNVQSISIKKETIVDEKLKEGGVRSVTIEEPQPIVPASISAEVVPASIPESSVQVS